MPLCETIYDLRLQAAILRRRPYGVIVVENSRLQAIHLRPWPKVFSAPDLVGAGRGNDRAERIQLVFSRPYDAQWKPAFDRDRMNS